MYKLKNLYSEIKLISTKEKDKIEKNLKVLQGKDYNMSREEAISFLRLNGSKDLKKKMDIYFPKNKCK